MSLPSGPGLRLISSAPNAFLYQSIVCAARSSVICGVMVRKPFGTGLAALAMWNLSFCGQRITIKDPRDRFLRNIAHGDNAPELHQDDGAGGRGDGCDTRVIVRGGRARGS